MAKKRITVDVPDEMHKSVKSEAAKEGRSLADIIRELLAAWLGKKEEDTKK
jgi:plasmid stability protein